MFRFSFEALGKTEQTAQMEVVGKGFWEVEHPVIEITPDLLKELTTWDGKSCDIIGFNAHLDCNNLALVVKGFEYFSLGAFSNTAPNLRYLKIYDAEEFCRINDLFIKRLDIEDSNLLLVGSQIDELYIGIEENMKNLRDERKELTVINFTDLRKSVVKNMRVFVPHNRIDISNTEINHLKIESPNAGISNQLLIWQNSSIYRMSFVSYIEKLQIEQSSIDILEFLPQGLVGEVEFKDYFISNVNNCNSSSIKSHSKESWKLIMDSARLGDDAEQYAIAGYEYMKITRRNHKGLSMVGYYLIEKICGYGFKPNYTIYWSVFTWFFYAMVYWILGVTGIWGQGLIGEIQLNGFRGIGNCLYYSIITFTSTGYGDILPKGALMKALAGSEALIGITLSAIFIFGLTKRYGSFR